MVLVNVQNVLILRLKFLKILGDKKAKFGIKFHERELQKKILSMNILFLLAISTLKRF